MRHLQANPPADPCAVAHAMPEPLPATRRRALHALAAVLALVASPKGAVAADTDVPFVVTPDGVTLAMLELAGVGPADHVIDLGSGDGRIVILAAKRFGASGLGVEIVDDLVERSRRNAELAGVATRVEFRRQDLFATDLSRATVVTMYLLPEVNLQLRPRLLGLRPGTRIVSHDYDLGDWRPDRSIVVDVPDKPVGRDKRSTLHLWVVPARVDGLWCATAGTSPLALHVDQRYQRVTARAVDRGVPLAGQVQGRRAELEASDGARLTLVALDDGLTVADADGPFAAWRGMRLSRGDAACVPPSALSPPPSAGAAPR